MQATSEAAGNHNRGKPNQSRTGNTDMFPPPGGMQGGTLSVATGHNVQSTNGIMPEPAE